MVAFGVLQIIGGLAITLLSGGYGANIGIGLIIEGA
jgi:hypothetical protein